MTSKCPNRLALYVAISSLFLAANSNTAAAAATTEQLESRIAQLEALIQKLEGKVSEQDEAISTVKEFTVATDANRASDSKPGTKVTLGGYIKADTTYSSYSGGDLAAGSAGRDFYIPGTIPVGGQNESTDTDYSAKESRFFLKTESDFNGKALISYIEMDFLLAPGGNERVSNGYQPRMRHAFLKYGKWMAGQSWSTFQDVGALAENLDFVGPAEGTVFERQPQIRYTHGNWQVALENPETTVTPFGGGARIVTDDNALPDVVMRYIYKEDWGWLSAATIARQLSYEDKASGIDDTESGFGISLSGKVKIGRDDIRFMLTRGSGLGRYVGLNTANGAVVDAKGDLEAIDSTSGFVSLRHFWNESWRSNLTLSGFSADNDTDLTGSGVTKQVYSVHLNLLYSPTPKITIGAEYMFAEREIESGADGDLDRFIFSMKYGF